MGWILLYLRALSHWLVSFDFAGIVGALIILLQALNNVIAVLNNRKLDAVHERVNGQADKIEAMAHAAGVVQGRAESQK